MEQKPYKYYMLTDEEAKNIQALLDRVEVKGIQEVLTFHNILVKLSQGVPEEAIVTKLKAE